MKYIFIIVALCAATGTKAQNYMLLDESISQPAVYTNHLNEMAKYKKYFPVAVKDLPEFLKVLEEIDGRLSEPKVTGPAKNYKIGCVEFTGKVFPLSSGERIDYVLSSDCENVKIRMHLCDAKLSNSDNAYFVKTWIKYIRSTMKQHK
ncbi:MAG: hypothetical protein ACTHNG_16220 [Ginsengibacter sp.]